MLKPETWHKNKYVILEKGTYFGVEVHGVNGFHASEVKLI